MSDETAAQGGNVNGYRGDPSDPGYERWREEICRHLFKLDIAPLSDGPINCKVTAALLPGVMLAGAHRTPMQFSECHTDSQRDDLALVLSSGNVMRLTDHQRELDLTARGICLTLSAFACKTRVGQVDDGQFKSIHIPRKTLLALCPHAEDLIYQPLNPDPALLEMLESYYDLTMRSAPKLDPLALHALSQHLVDLVVLALGTGGENKHLAQRRGAACARAANVKIDILSRLAEPDLGVTSVAQRAGVSPRSVQLMFEQDATTFTAFVLEQRLLLAFKLLTDPRRSSRKVSDIAHAAGFKDLSYFHRAFRRRFAMTPSEARAAATTAGANQS